MFLTTTALPLNEMEGHFKTYYLSHPADHIDNPDLSSVEPDEAVIGHLIAHGESETAPPLNTDVLNEQFFVPDELDCAFIRHLRYLPANWHTHEFFEMLYVLNGHAANIFKNHTIPMEAGDICICAPGSTHAVAAFSDDDILMNILIRKSSFEHSFMGLLEEDDILSTFFRRVLYLEDHIPYLLFHTKNEIELRMILQRAYDEFNGRHRFKKQQINICLSEFFITLFRMHEQDVDVPELHRRTSDVNIMHLLRYVQAHYTTTTLKELSAFFNYSERHLQRLLEEATGLGFTEILQNQRMKEAARLLSETDLPIEAVCGRVGYASSNNFRRIFAKFYGCTPREYRKEHRLHEMLLS